MKRADVVCMVPSPAVSLLATSTPSALLRVIASSFRRFFSFPSIHTSLGWSPATFVSSRTDRASKKQARPEDYMDDEDLAEMKDAQKLVDTEQESDLFSAPQEFVPFYSLCILLIMS